MTKSDERKNQSAAPVLIGAAVAVVPFLIVLLIASVLVKKEILPENADTLILCSAAFIGAFVGGFVTAKRMGRRYALYGASVGLALFAVRSVAAVIFSHGNFRGGTALPLLLSLTAGGFFGGLLPSRKGRRRRR